MRASIGEAMMSTTNEMNTAAIRWAEKRAEACKKLLGKTKVKYLQRHAYLTKVGKLAGQSERSCVRSYDRAASRYCLALEIIDAYAANDVSLVEGLWADVEQIESEAQINKKCYDNGERSGNGYKRNSKKASLKKLPDDWQIQLCKQMEKHKHYAAVRILACTGCRPCEVMTGVRVYRNEHGINFHIKGAKFKEEDERGQGWRVLTIPLNHPIGSSIADGEYTTKSAESLSKAITRKSEKLGFEGISAYSQRHQMASDMKSSKYSKKEIANVLGHISTATQQTYGNSGSGSMVVISVVSSATPRNKVKHSKRKFKPKMR